MKPDFQKRADVLWEAHCEGHGPDQATIPEAECGTCLASALSRAYSDGRRDGLEEAAVCVGRAGVLRVPFVELAGRIRALADEEKSDG